MENNNAKRLEALTTLLKSDKEDIILKTIKELRKEAPFAGALQQLALLYDNATNSKILQQIESFFNDIKETAVREEIIIEIQEEHKPETIRMLVASCWQSRLDYSEYLPLFAKLLLNSNYMTAIECATVISEHCRSLSDDKKSHLRETISAAKSTEYQPLIDDLINNLL